MVRIGEDGEGGEGVRITMKTSRTLRTIPGGSDETVSPKIIEDHYEGVD